MSDIAEETAREISRKWQAGHFRQFGGVVKGMTPIIRKAIRKVDRDWALALAKRRRRGLR